MLAYMKQAPGFYRRALILTLPIVLQNVITASLTMADTFMVGILGEAEMAALTLANIPAYVLQLFLFGVQNGTGILLSQYWGKGDVKSLSKAVGISLFFSLFASGAYALLMFQNPYGFMSLFGNQDQVIGLAAEYGRIIAFSYVLNGFSMMYVGAYRAMGKPQLGMYLLAISATVNLFLNWVLIYGNLGMTALGVKGAAWATLVARGLEVTIILCHLRFGKDLPLRISSFFTVDKAMLKKYWKYCAPVIFSETAWGLGTSVAPMVMGHMANSTEILAAYAIATNIEGLVMVAGFGIGASSGILIGNHIGAGLAKPQVLAMGQCLGMLGFLIGTLSGCLLLLVTFVLFPLVLAPLFQLSTQARDIVQIMLVMLSLMMGMRTFNTVAVVGVFRAGGDSRKSMLMDLCPLWFVAIPLTILAGSLLHLSIFWVVLAMKTEDFVKTIVGYCFLVKDTWINDVTRSEADYK